MNDVCILAQWPGGAPIRVAALGAGSKMETLFIDWPLGGNVKGS
jgi:hypothetical protein